MYIPSDFFSTNFRWVDAFPPHMPFTLNKPCSFHVMHKDVDPCNENTAVLEPSDADYLFSAKVCQEVVSQSSLYDKRFEILSKRTDIRSEIEIHIRVSKWFHVFLIYFLGHAHIHARHGRDIQKMLWCFRRQRSRSWLRSPHTSYKFLGRLTGQKRDNGHRWAMESFIRRSQSWKGSVCVN